MSDLRKPTSLFFSNNTDTPYTGRGFTKNCMTCNQWKVVGGWKKHPFRNYMECADCVEKRTKE